MGLEACLRAPSRALPFAAAGNFCLSEAAFDDVEDDEEFILLVEAGPEAAPFA